MKMFIILSSTCGLIILALTSKSLLSDDSAFKLIYFFYSLVMHQVCEEVIGLKNVALLNNSTLYTWFLIFSTTVKIEFLNG